MQTGADVESQMYASFSRDIRTRSARGRVNVPTMRQVRDDSIKTAMPVIMASTPVPRCVRPSGRCCMDWTNAWTPPERCISAIKPPTRALNNTTRVFPEDSNTETISSTARIVPMKGFPLSRTTPPAQIPSTRESITCFDQIAITIASAGGTRDNHP